MLCDKGTEEGLRVPQVGGHGLVAADGRLALERLGLVVEDPGQVDVHPVEGRRQRQPPGARVETRLAEPGEVLPAGGRVFSIDDLSDVYMYVYLPESVTGKVPLGSEARIVLDAAPQYPVRNYVSYVSPPAQFTPWLPWACSADPPPGIRLAAGPAPCARYWCRAPSPPSCSRRAGGPCPRVPCRSPTK